VLQLRFTLGTWGRTPLLALSATPATLACTVAGALSTLCSNVGLELSGVRGSRVVVVTVAINGTGVGGTTVCSLLLAVLAKAADWLPAWLPRWLVLPGAHPRLVLPCVRLALVTALHLLHTASRGNAHQQRSHLLPPSLTFSHLLPPSPYTHQLLTPPNRRPLCLQRTGLNMSGAFVTNTNGSANITGATTAITLLPAAGGLPAGSMQLFFGGASFSAATLPWNVSAEAMKAAVVRITGYDLIVNRVL
jgi:hypothetical protein